MGPEKSTTDHRPPTTRDPRRSQLACLNLSVHLTNLPAVVNRERPKMQRYRSATQCAARLPTWSSAARQPGAYERDEGSHRDAAGDLRFPSITTWIGTCHAQGSWCKVRITSVPSCIPGCPVKSNVTSPCPAPSLLGSGGWRVRTGSVGASIEFGIALLVRGR
jgi:hypothetical protein